MSYRALRHLDTKSLSNFALSDFFCRNRPVSILWGEKDIASHTVFELSGITCNEQSWVAYYNTTTQRSAVWILKNKYRSSIVGHFLAGWIELSAEDMDDYTSGADAGSLKIEQYLATTLPYWFWEPKIASFAVCEKQNRAWRKATSLATRESMVNLVLNLFSLCGTLAFAVCCTLFWLATLSVIN
jgi:hypothetical protein